MNWLKGLKARALFDEPLSKHTTLKVGPRADCWVEPQDRADLRALLKKARLLGKDYLVIGLGSKLLIKKKKLDLAVHLKGGEFSLCRAEGEYITAGAGVRMPQLLNTARDFGLGGLEFLNGIPATVGGAIRLNAGVGWPERIEIGAFVERLEVMDKTGRIKTLEKKDLEFGYRYSNLKRYIILKAVFGLFKKRKKNIRLKMRKFRDYRVKTQELGYPSAGCIFKNHNGTSSGRLIDLCGLKGRRIGDAAVSAKHANFILNMGKASSSDVLALMNIIQKEVKDKFNLELEPEIQLI